MDLLLTRLDFLLRLPPGHKPHQLLERLRKTFRDCFRAIVCRQPGGCDCCPDTHNCPYRLIFGQVLAADPEAVRRHQKPPLPFVFELRPVSWNQQKGVSFELGLVLVGSATYHVPVFCATLMAVFRSLPGCYLAGIDSVGCSGSAAPVLNGDGAIALDRLATISAEDILAVSTLPPDQARLNFITPLCIVQDGKAIREFSFSRFIATLLRRVSSLAYYYGGSALELDYKRLSGLGKEVRIVENALRYTDRDNCQKEGLTGSCLVTGNLYEFHPVLLLGEYLHCGKGAAYGMGRYRISRPVAGK